MKAAQPYFHLIFLIGDGDGDGLLAILPTMIINSQLLKCLHHADCYQNFDILN